MEQCAIVLNGNDVIKVTNLKRKYNKIINNSNMKILEECNIELVEDKYNYWKSYYKSADSEEEDVKLYYFKNPITNYTIISIYPDLENCKSYVNDWRDYERVN